MNVENKALLAFQAARDEWDGKAAVDEMVPRGKTGNRESKELKANKVFPVSKGLPVPLEKKDQWENKVLSDQSDLKDRPVDKDLKVKKVNRVRLDQTEKLASKVIPDETVIKEDEVQLVRWELEVLLGMMVKKGGRVERGDQEGRVI